MSSQESESSNPRIPHDRTRGGVLVRAPVDLDELDLRRGRSAKDRAAPHIRPLLRELEAEAVAIEADARR